MERPPLVRPVHSSEAHAAETALGVKLLGEGDLRVENDGRGGGEGKAGRRSLLDDPVRLFQCRRHRLLAVNVLASVQRGEIDLRMHLVTRQVHDDIDVSTSQKIPIIAEHVFTAEFGLGPAGTGLVDVRKRCQPS